MKKIASIVLALILVLAMAAPAMAEGATGYTITIEPAAEGHTYEAYQIFTGRLEGDVLSDIVWGEGVNGDVLLTALKGSTNDAFMDETEEGTKVNKFASCETAAHVAGVLSNTGEESDIAQAFADIVGLNLTSKTSGTVSATENGYKITGLEAGYYLVKDKDNSVSGNDFYTRYILEVVKDVDVIPKGDVPEVDKTITGEGDAADYNIGDTVPFTLTGTLPTDYNKYEKYAYTFHDTLSEGLTFQNDVVVKVDGATIETGYTVVTEDLDDGCTFEVVFTDLKLIASVTANSEITVEYTAKLNEKAVIGKDGNTNTVKLEYSNNPNDMGDGTPTTGETPEDKVIVFTYELDVTKQDGSTQAKLEGAEFVLYREVKVEGAEEPSKKYVTVDSANKVTGWTIDKEEASVLKSDANGLFKVIGLDDGTYYLEETTAPTGYNKLEKPVKVVITATITDTEDEQSLDALKIDVTVTTDGQETTSEGTGNVDTGIVSTTVNNNKGATLPSTGGMGTTVLYVVGGLLIAGAAIALITKKRMASK